MNTCTCTTPVPNGLGLCRTCGKPLPGLPERSPYGPSPSGSDFYRIKAFDVPLVDWRIWKWALTRRKITWPDLFIAAMKLVVKETAEREIARGKPVPPDIAAWIAQGK